MPYAILTSALGIQPGDAMNFRKNPTTFIFRCCSWPTIAKRITSKKQLTNAQFLSDEFDLTPDIFIDPSVGIQ